MNTNSIAVSPVLLVVLCTLVVAGVAAAAYKYWGTITWYTHRAARFQELCASMVASRAMLKKCGADGNTLVITDVEKLYVAFLAEASAGGCGSPGLTVISNQIRLRGEELRALAEEAAACVLTSVDMDHKRTELMRMVNEMQASVASMHRRIWTPESVFSGASVGPSVGPQPIAGKPRT